MWPVYCHYTQLVSSKGPKPLGLWVTPKQWIIDKGNWLIWCLINGDWHDARCRHVCLQSLRICENCQPQISSNGSTLSKRADKRCENIVMGTFSIWVRQVKYLTFYATYSQRSGYLCTIKSGTSLKYIPHNLIAIGKFFSTDFMLLIRSQSKSWYKLDHWMIIIKYPYWLRLLIGHLQLAMLCGLDQLKLLQNFRLLLLCPLGWQKCCHFALGR